MLHVGFQDWSCSFSRSRILSGFTAASLSMIAPQEHSGPEGLFEEDRFLLECNFDKLTSMTGEQQEYWLLAIQAACKASHLHAEATAA
jgi:hypothetical protein